VAYYSNVLGARGAILTAVLSAFIIFDRIHDRHPALLALEIGQIAAISLFGAAMATVANRDRLADQEVSASSRRRIETLAGPPGYWDRVAVTRMGQ
jgi:hypothetical protein